MKKAQAQFLLLEEPMDRPPFFFKKNAKLTLKQKIQRAKIKLSGSMWIKPFHVKVIVWMK